MILYASLAAYKRDRTVREIDVPTATATVSPTDAPLRGHAAALT